MRKFIGHKVEVETDRQTADPVAVVDRERRWEVAAIEKTWFDTGHGGTPVSARSWRTRRHRKNFLLLATNGERLTVYLDYKRSDDPVWHLVTVEEAEQ